MQNAVAWLKDECGLDDSGAEQLVEYIVTGRAVLTEVPTQDCIIAERFFDEGGGMQLIIHAPFGGRINKAWGLALRKRFCRSFNFELQAAATDNGLNIALAEQHSFPLSDVFHYLQTETVQGILEQAALASPIFATRWRWDANRSLALLRFQGGKKRLRSASPQALLMRPPKGAWMMSCIPPPSSKKRSAMMQSLRRDLSQYRAAGDDVLDELLGAGIVKPALVLQPCDRVLHFRAGFDAAQTGPWCCGRRCVAG